MNTPTPNPALLADLTASLRAEEDAARADFAAGRPRGPITGFKSLDRELGGFLAPGIHTLLAAPGAGKTAIALQIAGQCGCPALFVTCEMRPTDLLRRITAQVTGNVLNNFKGGRLADTDLSKQTQQAADAYSQLAIYDATIQPPSPEAIRDAALALRDNRFSSRHILIVVDSLTDWAASMSADMTEYQANEYALNALKKIALELACPVLLIVHRNRSGQADESNKMFAGKATGRIEYISETMWNIEHSGNKEPNINGQTQKKLTLLKNRNGSPFVDLTFLFEGRCQRYSQG